MPRSSTILSTLTTSLHLLLFTILFHHSCANSKNDHLLRIRQPPIISEFDITFALSLGIDHSILDSSLLRHSLEVAVKDAANKKIACNQRYQKSILNTNNNNNNNNYNNNNNNVNDNNVFVASLVSLSIDTQTSAIYPDGTIIARGKCIGDLQDCSVIMNTIPEEFRKNERFSRQASTCELPSNAGLCNSDIGIGDFLDAYLPDVPTSFDYNLILGNNQVGGINVVTGFGIAGRTLSKRERVFSAAVQKARATNTFCQTSSCKNQASTIQDIFSYFEIPFDEDSNVCTYSGIKCDGNGLITIIIINNCGVIDKVVPESFSTFSSLRMLNLGGNQLTGTIPTKLGLLSNLEVLLLHENEFSGTIPTQLGNLRKLTELYIYDNYLTGSIPPQFINLQNLNNLHLGTNYLSMPIPFLSPLNNLQGLYLEKNALSGNLVAATTNLPNVEILSLGRNRFTGNIPSELGLLDDLIYLDLSSNLLEGQIPSEIGMINQIEYINLYRNSLNGKIPAEIGQLTNLKELILEENALSGTIPPEIGDLINLKVLTLYKNSISGLFPIELANLVLLDTLVLDTSNMIVNNTIPDSLGLLTGVRYIDFANERLEGTIPSELGLIEGLEYLTLDNNNLVGTVPSELGDIDSLIFLELYDNFLTGSIPSEIGKLQDLEHLTMGNNLFTGTIPSDFGSLVLLLWLDITENTLTGSIPSELGSISTLEYLNIPNNQLTAPIPSELGQLQSLQWMHLGFNRLFGMIPTELGSLTSLEWFDLRHNFLSGTIPTELGNMNNNRHIDLEVNRLSGPIPTELGNIDTLLFLDVDNNTLTGLVPTELSKISSFSFDFNLLSTYSPTISPAPSISLAPSSTSEPTVVQTISSAPTACYDSTLYPPVNEGVASLTRENKVCLQSILIGFNFGSAHECVQNVLAGNYYFDDDYYGNCNGYEVMFDSRGKCSCCPEIPDVNCPSEDMFYPEANINYYPVDTNVYQYSNPEEYPKCCKAEYGITVEPSLSPVTPTVSPTPDGTPRMTWRDIDSICDLYYFIRQETNLFLKRWFNRKLPNLFWRLILVC